MARIFDWGHGGSDRPRELAARLTREFLESHGITLADVTWWRDLYRYHMDVHPATNPSAPGRYDLMQKAAELLGGGRDGDSA
jgi:hypothetical protein